MSANQGNKTEPTSSVEAVPRPTPEVIDAPEKVLAKLSEVKANGKGRPKGRPATFKFKGPSVVAAVEASMRTTTARDQEKAAKEVGINKDNYRIIRKLLVIRDDLTQTRETRDDAIACLTTIEKTRGIAKVRHQAKALIDAHIPRRKERTSVVNLRRRRFDQTIMTIRESSSSTTDMQVPRDLPMDVIMDAVASLAASAEQINRLIRRLVGGSSHVEEGKE